MSTHYVGAGKVRRFPRLAEVVKGKEMEHVALVAPGWRLMGHPRNPRKQHRKSRIELGRELLKLKDTVNHGEWEACYADRYGDGGVSFRSAQRCMRLAKNVKCRLLKPANERGGELGERTRNANQQANAESRARREKKAQVDKHFKRFTGEVMMLPDGEAKLQEVYSVIEDLRDKFGIKAEAPQGEVMGQEVRLETAAD